MLNIYIPIDSSEAKKAIPIGEDIHYSTRAKYVRDNGKKVYRLHTHLLLTDNGLAYMKDDPKYKPWYKVVMMTLGPQRIFSKKINPRYFEIERDEDHESKEGFKARKKEFIYIALELYVNALKNRIEELNNNPEICSKKELKNQLKNLPKRLSKHSKYLERHKKKKGGS